MNLKDKVVVITGGSKGLGLSMAKILVQRGSKVVICGRETDVLEGVAKGLDVKTFTADVTDEAQLSGLASFSLEQFGKIDLWINNAGIWLPRESIESTDMDKVRKLFNINVFGTMNGSRVAIRQLKSQAEGGTLVNIISTTAFDGMNGSSGAAYVASKYALRGFTNALRDECVGTKINVIGVYPGGIKTELFKEAPPTALGDFMDVDEVAGKVIKNLEQEVPETQLIISRPGQKISNELRSITKEN
jgi:NAD(P)-dependent dehydrogenase (short-subunit alcohol dehydrogenase family)